MSLPRFRPPAPRAQHRAAVRNPVDVAKRRATRLTPAEIDEALAAGHQCEARLREGVATEGQFAALRTYFAIAEAIERRGIVRGLHEHFASANDAMDSIHARATATGVWRQTALHYYELDAIREGLRLLRYQMEQLSAGEVHDIVRQLMAQTQSQGGAVERRSLKELGLAAA